MIMLTKILLMIFGLLFVAIIVVGFLKGELELNFEWYKRYKARAKLKKYLYAYRVLETSTVTNPTGTEHKIRIQFGWLHEPETFYVKEYTPESLQEAIKQHYLTEQHQLYEQEEQEQQQQQEEQRRQQRKYQKLSGKISFTDQELALRTLKNEPGAREILRERQS